MSSNQIKQILISSTICGSQLRMLFRFQLVSSSFFQGVEPNERTHLLPNPVNNSPTIIAHNGDLLRENQSTVPQKNELNALNRIVQDFAT